MGVTDSKEEKPLNVRCAEALGWKKPSEEGRCDVCGWALVPHPEPGCWADNCSFRPMPETRHDIPPPYGEDSPEGWACTGPLMDRFQIRVQFLGLDRVAWAEPAEMTLEAEGKNSCAAIAEWVAAHGAQARAKEAQRG